MRVEEARVILPALEAAAAMAMAHYTHVNAALKSDRTPVTEADLAVQALLVEVLDDHYPRDGIVAEEEGLRKVSQSGRYWTVDPIDGTIPFVAGLSSWSIAVGLLDENQPVAGFIYLPPSRDCFHTVPGEPARRNGLPMRLKMAGPLGSHSLLLTHSRPHQRYDLSAAFPGRVLALGSASVHLAHVATGAADAVIIGHDKIWDLAPGLALLKASGGVLRYLDGTDVAMGALLDGAPAPLPMLGGHLDTICQVRETLNYWASHENAHPAHGW